MTREDVGKIFKEVEKKFALEEPSWAGLQLMLTGVYATLDAISGGDPLVWSWAQDEEKRLGWDEEEAFLRAYSDDYWEPDDEWDEDGQS